MVKKRAGTVSRIRKLTKRQKKSLDKKTVRSSKKIPTSFQLLREVYQLFRTSWRKLLGIVVVYLVLNIVFASWFGAITGAISNIKADFNTTGGHHFISAITGFGSLLGSAGTSSSSTSSVLQSMLIVVESLVIIWALRQLLAGKPILVKEAYYRSMAPFIPFLLVIAVIIIQLLPVIFGTTLVGAILSAVFNSSGLLTIIFGIIFAALAAWSIYLVSSSIFALYIVTLPDMQPVQALRSAKNLVQYRRWTLLRRLLFLPIFVVLVAAIIIVPLILYATWFVAPIFYFLGMVAILFIHSYLYSLYRSLLD